MKIILKGEPKSTQNMYKMSCRGRFAKMYISQAGNDLKSSYIKQAKKQYADTPIANPVKVGIDLYFGTRRVSDWDNFHKLSMDALTGIVWEDDSQINQAMVTKHYDKENPRIEIEIEPYETNL